MRKIDEAMVEQQASSMNEVVTKTALEFGRLAEVPAMLASGEDFFLRSQHLLKRKDTILPTLGHTHFC